MLLQKIAKSLSSIQPKNGTSSSQSTKPKTTQQRTIRVDARGLRLTLIDDCKTQNVPLLDIKLSDVLGVIELVK